MSDSESDTVSSMMTQRETSEVVVNSPASNQSQFSQNFYSPLPPRELSMQEVDESQVQREQYEWQFVRDVEKKEKILANQYSKYRWSYNISNGRVVKCCLHEDCDYRVQICRICKQIIIVYCCYNIYIF